jgi:ABC-2 type transport system ATP-binding protein
MIELESIHKRFGETVAVRDVSFRAQPGEVFGIIGPNGAGKSTSIRILLNIYRADSGRVLFGNRAFRESDKERIGYLPEERGLYPKVKVGQLLHYLARLKGTAPGDADSRIDWWLRRFDLADRRESRTDSLSKGMSQKVQFIAAVIHDPEILILDEPFAGLDPVSVDVLREAVTELRNAGKTVLFSTHVMEQAERVCDRLLLIDRGQVVLHGTLDEIRRRFGSNSVRIEFDGDPAILRQHSAVSELAEYPRYLEARLAEGADSNALLRDLIEHATIHRFERVAPSLHSIFVDMVGGRRSSANGNPRNNEALNGETPNGHAETGEEAR